MAPFYNSSFCNSDGPFLFVGQIKTETYLLPDESKKSFKNPTENIFKIEFGYIDKLWCLLPVKVSIFG